MNATPPPTPILNCHIVGAQTLTVGQKSNFTCEAVALGDVKQKKLEFVQSDPKANYEIQFLGQPVFAQGAINQIFTSYKTGRHTLSQIQLKVDDQIIKVNPIDFEVKSVIAQVAGSKPTPFPEVDPAQVAVPTWWWVMWGVGLGLVLILLLWRFIKYRQKRRVKTQQEVLVNLSPQEKFQMALRQLETKGLHTRGAFKSFAVELTYIVKKTIGQEMHFPAEDLTSEELLSTLERNHSAYFNAAGTSLSSFLADLDRIKFAKVETTLEQCNSLLDKASRIGNAIFRSFS